MDTVRALRTVAAHYVAQRRDKAIVDALHKEARLLEEQAQRGKRINELTDTALATFEESAHADTRERLRAVVEKFVGVAEHLESPGYLGFPQVYGKRWNGDYLISAETADDIRAIVDPQRFLLDGAVERVRTVFRVA